METLALRSGQQETATAAPVKPTRTRHQPFNRKERTVYMGFKLSLQVTTLGHTRDRMAHLGRRSTRWYAAIPSAIPASCRSIVLPGPWFPDGFEVCGPRAGCPIVLLSDNTYYRLLSTQPTTRLQLSRKATYALGSGKISWLRRRRSVPRRIFDVDELNPLTRLPWRFSVTAFIYHRNLFLQNSL